MITSILAQLIGLSRYKTALKRCLISDEVDIPLFTYQGKRYDRNLFIRFRMETMGDMPKRDLEKTKADVLARLKENDVQRKELDEAELEAIERLLSGQKMPPFERPTPPPVEQKPAPTVTAQAPPTPPQAPPSAPSAVSSVELLEQLRDELEAEHQKTIPPAKCTRSPLAVGLGVLSALLVVAVCVLSYQLVSANQKIEALAQSNQTLAASLSRVEEADIYQAALDFVDDTNNYIDYIENKDNQTKMRLLRMRFGISNNTPDYAVSAKLKARYLDGRNNLLNTTLITIGSKSIVVVASSQSDKYHTLSCDYVDQILSENRIYYATVKEAEDAGKTPCSVCRP